MTTIRITQHEIEVSGHSGYADVDNDIVCAAISTLTQSTYNYLRCTGNLIRKHEGEAYFLIKLLKLSCCGKKIVKKYESMIDDLINQYPLYLRKEKVNEKIR